jgi:hypothetical protein
MIVCLALSWLPVGPDFGRKQLPGLSPEKAGSSLDTEIPEKKYSDSRIVRPRCTAYRQLGKIVFQVPSSRAGAGRRWWPAPASRPHSLPRFFQ